MPVIFAGCVAAVLLLLYTLLVSLPVWFLWNWLAPALHLPSVGLLQAAALVLLVRLLTGSGLTLKVG